MRFILGRAPDSYGSMMGASDSVAWTGREMRFIRPSHHRADHLLRWITEDLAVAAAPAAQQWRSLRAQGIRCALDLRTLEEGGGSDPVTPDLAYRWFPIGDGRAPAPADLLEISSWLADNLRSGNRAVINCREGRGRSALLACATLMRLGYALDSAYQVVRRGQPQVALSDDQVKVLEGMSNQ